MPHGVKSENDIKLEDSNMWKVGSDEDKAHRKECASREPAWATAGKEEGIQIWRVEHFTLVAVPSENYGKFHTGDSYIILQTEPTEGNIFIHTIFFWLGGETSIDEQGTAAYKTVELDDYMSGAPQEFREVQGEESEKFQALFPGGLEYLAGGVDSGFRHVVPNGEYDTKLYHARRHKGKVTVFRCPVSVDSLTEGDAFILDSKGKIYVYEGPKADGFEKNRANMFGKNLETERDEGKLATHDMDDEFWRILGGKPEWENRDAV